MDSLSDSNNAMTNDELISNLSKAKDAHKNWIKNLKRIIDEMTV